MPRFDVDPIEGFEVGDAQIGFIVRPDDIVVRRADGMNVFRRRDLHTIPRRANIFPLRRKSDRVPLHKNDYIAPLVKVAV